MDWGGDPGSGSCKFPFPYSIARRPVVKTVQPDNLISKGCRGAVQWNTYPNDFRRTSKVPEVWILPQERCLTSGCRGRPTADHSDVRSGEGEGFIRGIFLKKKLPCIGPCCLTLNVIVW